MKKNNQRSLFRDGGWALLLSAFLSMILIFWAFAPAIFRLYDRPPGDGASIISYNFNLENSSVELSSISPAMLYRDMPPVYKKPSFISRQELDIINSKNKARPLITSNDLVIGVSLNGLSKAYPLRWLNVHEIINDNIGDTPIAVSWHWPSGCANVFNRLTEDKTIELGNTGLVLNGNLLMFDRSDASESNPYPKSSLISQWHGEYITGQKKGQKIKTIKFDFVPWKTWSKEYPETKILAPYRPLMKRYKKMNPKPYFLSGRTQFQTKPSPKEDLFSLKEMMIRIQFKNVEEIYSLKNIIQNATNNKIILKNNLSSIPFVVTEDPDSVYSKDARVKITQMLRFSQYAHDPNTKISIVGTNE